MILERWIRKRLNDYCEVVNTVHPDKPIKPGVPRTVAVVGGGLAGIAAASLLAERGFKVTLFEKNSYLGGKCGGWEVSFPDGSQAMVDHGFHAFFGHYYNLLAFLEKIGSTKFFQRIDDYAILTQSKQRFSFKNVHRTPILNILSMMKTGFFRFRDVILNPGSRHMGEFLRYDESRSFEAYDGLSFEEFARQSGLPSSLRLVFNTFARAFFAPADRLSTAQLMKSFHFFYLSNDCGLLYDYFTRDYGSALLEPVVRHLRKLDVDIKLNQSVHELSRREGGFEIHSERFDYVVLATHVVGTKSICENSSWLREQYPDAYHQITSVQASSGYAVYRIWLDARVQEDWPVFIITDKYRILDSVTFFHLFEPSAKAWAEKQNGGVYELHCYALPDEIQDRSQVKQSFLHEFYEYFPELRKAHILHEHLQVNHDFTALYTGLQKNRPQYRTAVPGLYLAGDWVRIPTPAMLMEGAFTSGLFCANGILSENELREEPIRSVPLKGIFA
ncbi:MAG: FAD-dependent oxidoreductase [Deltaproteobacteria bacterium]|nr:FAD-dependent oxidoreductase [Deltaproteobacteria bacterium]